MKPRYIIAIGSSHAQGLSYISKAIDTLNQSTTISLSGKSKIYENCSMNMLHNYLCYNCAVAVRTNLLPHSFYRELFKLEHRLGRVRSYRNAPRTLDLDVLMSLDLTYISSHFFIPHKDLYERNFFVIPAIEALKSAGWPLPLKLLKSGMKFGTGYLKHSI